MPQHYQVSLENNYYTFITQHNIIYRISFNTDNTDIFKGYDDLLFNLKVLSITQINQHDEIIPLDLCVRNTICDLIKKILQNDPNLVLFFILDDNDSKSYKRLFTFIRWNQYCENLGNYDFNFSHFNFKQTDDFIGEMGFAGYIIKDTNPLKHDIKKWEVEIQYKINVQKDIF